MTAMTRKLSVILVVGFAVAGIAVWLLLASPMLAKARGNIAAGYLSEALGQPVEIGDGLRVGLGPALRVTAKGLVLPSGQPDGAAPVRVEKVSFDLAVPDLLNGRADPRNLRIDGASVAVSVDATGKAFPAFLGESSAPQKAATAGAQTGSFAAGKAPLDGALGFLAGRTIRLANSAVTYRDVRNGLEIDMSLASLELQRADTSAPLRIDGEGTLNGEAIRLSATVPPAQPFMADIVASKVRATLTGAPDKDGYGAGLSADLSLQIDDLGQLLDMLKLQKPLSGNGKVSAAYRSTGGTARIDDLNVQVRLDGGQSVEVTGDLGEIGNPADVSLDTRIRLYPENGEPPAARMRRDLKLVSVDMSLTAQPSGIPKRGMVIKTNGFVLDTSGEGPPPIEVSGLARTADGLLRLGRVVLRIGPPEAHFLVLEGAVADALRLEGIEAEAVLALPAASLLAPERFQASEVLGKVTGGFRASGNARELAISQVNATSEGTDLWHLDVAGSVRNALTFSGVALELSADLPSAGNFLKALELKPVETGPVSLSADLNSKGTEWNTRVLVEVADSELSLYAELDADEAKPMVRGGIESDLIRIGQLREIVNASVELAKLDDKPAHSKADAGPGSAGDLQPLVIGETSAAGPDALAFSDGQGADPSPAPGGDLQPLVLEQPEEPGATDEPRRGGNAEGPFRDVTLQPLGRAILLSGVDIGIVIDLRKIKGPKGETSFKADLVLKDRKARFGPATFDYGGGHFEVTGAMDLAEDPETLNLSGATSGWDFGEIMKELRFKKGASGTLHASFEVSGKTESVDAFLRSMDGNATVRMNNGSIDTQLLDVAGLGVVPWLFSKEPGSRAPIVCLRAPLHVSGGRVSTKQAVVETDLVQVVVFGDVDVGKKTLDVTGQPRRIGRPLSRSPWPFTIAGSFSDPKVKVKDGPKRLRRSDGATTMPSKRKLCVPDILQLK